MGAECYVVGSERHRIMGECGWGREYSKGDRIQDRINQIKTTKNTYNM
jgi:hypothetical protein